MATDTDTVTTFDKIIALTEIEREDDETAEALKERVVRHFADTYPNTDEGNAAFDELDEDVQDWVNAASEVVRANRGARTKKPLPTLDGLEDDTPKKKGRATKGRATSSKEEGEKTPRGPILRKELASTFAAVPEGAKVSVKLSKPLRARGFKRQKELSKAGHFVFAHEDGREFHIGPGKGEVWYLMGWRPNGEKQHQYGGPALEKYLAENG